MSDLGPGWFIVQTLSNYVATFISYCRPLRLVVDLAARCLHAWSSCRIKIDQLNRLWSTSCQLWYHGYFVIHDFLLHICPISCSAGGGNFESWYRRTSSDGLTPFRGLNASRNFCRSHILCRNCSRLAAYLARNYYRFSSIIKRETR